MALFQIITSIHDLNLKKILSNHNSVVGFFFSFEQRKAEPFVRHNCFVAIPPVFVAADILARPGRTPMRQPFLAPASQYQRQPPPRFGARFAPACRPAGQSAGQTGQPAPLQYGAIALCSQVDSRLSGSGGTIITRYTKSLPGSILHSRQRSQNFALLALATYYVL